MAQRTLAPRAQIVRWHALDDAAALCGRVAQEIARRAEDAIAARGRFSLVLAGGNTPREVYRRLRGLATDWSAWHFFYGDERCLAPHDAARNSRMVEEAWLAHVPVPARQIHVIPAELGAHRAAAAYAETLAGEGVFDLVLLGLGEDGHTASLFPGHDWGVADDASDTIAVLDAPKPPPERVSLSARRLSRAAAVFFLVSGAAKRDAVAAWQNGAAIPAAAITPPDGVDVWLEKACL